MVILCVLPRRAQEEEVFISVLTVFHIPSQEVVGDCALSILDTPFQFRCALEVVVVVVILSAGTVIFTTCPVS